jgi:hypothetical protein
MRSKVSWLVAAIIVATAFGQDPQATIRVEVTAESVPVQAADVTINGKSVRTGQDGTVTLVALLGDVRISVSKEGYFPANASLVADAAREWVVHVELQPRKAVEEEIKVYATRNDVRIQDSPLHVEVLQRDEVEEKMLMTPGDIVMMLNEMGGCACKPRRLRWARPACACKACAAATPASSPTACPCSASKARVSGSCRFPRWTWARWK